MGAIVGRDAELQAGDAFAREVVDRPTLLLLEGEAGIGKTTVWAGIADQVRSAGITVLRSQPAQAETSLTLSALADLLEGVPESTLERLPAAQRRAIDAALLRAEPTADALAQRLLGVAVRNALVDLSAVAPVVVAVDDLHWLDPASAVTLSYALRRLGGARVGVLASRRVGVPSPLDLQALPTTFARHVLQIGPLTLGALHHVLKLHLGSPPARSTLVRVHEASGGNPLFALEIVRLLAEIGEPPADQRLPVPPDVRELVRQRVRRLPQATREVLLAAAAQAQPTVTNLNVALKRDVATDLDVASRDEIVSVDGEVIRFAHPLFAAAIYTDASSTFRRGIHARLAETAEGIEERVRHRALAATTPDHDVAGELDDAARHAAARGAPSAGADLLRLSLRLTPASDGLARDDRRIALGQHLQRAGDVLGAERVLAEAAAGASTRRNRARALLALADVRFEHDPGPSCARLAAEALGDVQDDAELLAYAHAMLAAVEYGDRRAASRHAREAKRLLDALEHPSPIVESLVLYVYIGCDVAAGAPLPAGLIDRALAIERVAPAPNVSDRLSASLGYWLMVNDDLAGARHWMEATYAAAVDEGDEGSVPYALSHLPMLELAAGNWPRAEEVAKQHLAAASELGQANQRLQALFNLSYVLVHQGREDDARQLIGELLHDAEEAGSLWDLTKGLAALGALELSIGNAGKAAPVLLQADEGRDALGDEEPRRHEADLVESLVAIGDIERAEHVVRAMDERARRYGRHSRLAVAARARAVVAAATGQLDAATGAVEAALHEHGAAPIPFDHARTLLVLGQVRRRRRERTLAREAFETAIATFERLGASVWAARAHAELDRVGLRRSAPNLLTEGERRVAELAASGMTNREVASTLFVSPKTVEANLGRAYQKLGVRSRAELGAVMAGGGRPARS